MLGYYADKLTKIQKKWKHFSLRDFFIFQKTPLIGLDISTSSINIIELNRSEDRYQIESYITLSIDSGLDIQLALQEAIKLCGTTRQFAAIALKNSEVITRVLKIDASFKKYEIVEYIEAEFDRLAPFQYEEAYYDFEILPALQPAAVQEIVLVIAKRATVQRSVALLHAAGIKVTVVDSEQLVLERASQFSETLNSCTPFAGMDISEKINPENLINDAPLLMTALGLALRTFDDD